MSALLQVHERHDTCSVSWVQFYEDSCLLDQKYVLDETRKVGQVLADTGKQIGADLHIQDFVRFQCGEGLEKEESNFADEVSQALQQTA